MSGALVKIAVLLVAFGAAGAGCRRAHSSTPEPPQIEALGDMDPEVGALLRELRAAIQRDRADAGAWGRFGMACEANGFVGAARRAYEISADLAPDEPRWRYRLALVTSRLGEHDAALAALVRTNDLAPNYAPAWTRRGT